jgi:hypothetical protein
MALLLYSGIRPHCLPHRGAIYPELRKRDRGNTGGNVSIGKTGNKRREGGNV